MRMKIAYKICAFISLVLTAVFVIKCVADYFSYDPIVNSAPFYVWIIMNALYFLIPSVISLIIGTIIMKKYQKQLSERDS